MLRLYNVHDRLEKKPKNKNAAGSSRIINVSHSGILLLTKTTKLIPRAKGIASHSFLK